jgi:methionyl-tRNA formyltransferase
MKPKIVFMGSPDFAVPSLAALARKFDVVGVVTQPDRPAGRGRILTSPPVKLLADQLGIPAIQPEKLREPSSFTQLQSWKPDLIIVAAFGQILRKNVLELPPLGCINVHASLLSRWRGAAPIQAAILHGDAQTGISIMKMDAGVDTGAILAQKVVGITPEDTAGTLSDRLAQIGSIFLCEVLPDYLEGKLIPKLQDESMATYAGMIQKEEGMLDFNQPAEVLARRVRAYNPWPSAFMFWEGQTLKIHKAHPKDGVSFPGKHGIENRLPAVGTVNGWLVLEEVQPAGKKNMLGNAFLSGARDWLETAE